MLLGVPGCCEWNGLGGYREEVSSPDEVDECREKQDLARKNKKESKPPLAGCVHITASKGRGQLLLLPLNLFVL